MKDSFSAVMTYLSVKLLVALVYSFSSWNCCLQKYPTGSSMKSAKASHKISVTGIRSVDRAANLLQLQTARNSTSEALIDQEAFKSFNQPRQTFNSLQRAATMELQLPLVTVQFWVSLCWIRYKFELYDNLLLKNINLTVTANKE